MAGQIFENVKAATENLPSQGEFGWSELTIDELAANIGADRPIPPIDLTASEPAGLYSLDDIVTETELSLIDAASIYALPNETARLAAFPNKYSPRNLS